MICLLSTHDHYDEDGSPLTCADCGAPLYYDLEVEDYRHEDTTHACYLHLEGGGCLLVSELEAATGSLRAGAPTELDAPYPRGAVRAVFGEAGSRSRHPSSRS